MQFLQKILLTSYIFDVMCAANSHNMTNLQIRASSSTSSCSPVVGGPVCRCNAGNEELTEMGIHVKVNYYIVQLAISEHNHDVSAMFGIHPHTAGVLTQCYDTQKWCQMTWGHQDPKMWCQNLILMLSCMGIALTKYTLRHFLPNQLAIYGAKIDFFSTPDTIMIKKLVGKLFKLML